MNVNDRALKNEKHRFEFAHIFTFPRYHWKIWGHLMWLYMTGTDLFFIYSDRDVLYTIWNDKNRHFRAMRKACIPCKHNQNKNWCACMRYAYGFLVFDLYKIKIKTAFGIICYFFTFGKWSITTEDAGVMSLQCEWGYLVGHYIL